MNARLWKATPGEAPETKRDTLASDRDALRELLEVTVRTVRPLYIVYV